MIITVCSIKTELVDYSILYNKMRIERKEYQQSTYSNITIVLHTIIKIGGDKVLSISR